MKKFLKRIAVGMMSLAAFAMVLIPAVPASAAAGMPAGAVDILRDPAMLARLKKADPRLHARIAGQAGELRVRITAAEFRKLKRLGAIEAAAQRKALQSTDFSSRKKSAATEFSSQARLTVTANPFNQIVTDLEAASVFWGDLAKRADELSKSFPVVAPVTAIIASVASFIKLIIVDPGLAAAKVAQAAYAAGEKTVGELPRCFPFWPFFCRAK